MPTLYTICGHMVIYPRESQDEQMGSTIMRWHPALPGEYSKKHVLLVHEIHLTRNIDIEQRSENL